MSTNSSVNNSAGYKYGIVVSNGTGNFCLFLAPANLCRVDKFCQVFLYVAPIIYAVLTPARQILHIFENFLTYPASYRRHTTIMIWYTIWTAKTGSLATLCVTLQLFYYLIIILQQVSAGATAMFMLVTTKEVITKGTNHAVYPKFFYISKGNKGYGSGTSVKVSAYSAACNNLRTCSGNPPAPGFQPTSRRLAQF